MLVKEEWSGWKECGKNKKRKIKSFVFLGGDWGVDFKVYFF